MGYILLCSLMACRGGFNYMCFIIFFCRIPFHIYTKTIYGRTVDKITRVCFSILRVNKFNLFSHIEYIHWCLCWICLIKLSACVFVMIVAVIFILIQWTNARGLRHICYSCKRWWWWWDVIMSSKQLNKQFSRHINDSKFNVSGVMYVMRILRTDRVNDIKFNLNSGSQMKQTGFCNHSTCQLNSAYSLIEARSCWS